MGAGVAGAIKRAGGEEIEREALAQAPIDPGDAVATKGGRLAARYVIHGAVMGQDLRTDVGLVGRTTERCLALADELGARSLALPAFGTGVGRLPLEECAEAMAEAVRRFRPHVLERVVFAVHGGEAEAAFSRALRQVDSAR
ncbi:MAG: macro domain-containing protein [Thermoleophilia bacterium]|nr:macro domain-containing protein [Thermoleophilia bacterium]